MAQNILNQLAEKERLAKEKFAEQRIMATVVGADAAKDALEQRWQKENVERNQQSSAVGVAPVATKKAAETTVGTEDATKQEKADFYLSLRRSSKQDDFASNATEELVATDGSKLVIPPAIAASLLNFMEFDKVSSLLPSFPELRRHYDEAIDLGLKPQLVSFKKDGSYHIVLTREDFLQYYSAKGYYLKSQSTSNTAGEAIQSAPQPKPAGLAEEALQTAPVLTPANTSSKKKPDNEELASSYTPLTPFDILAGPKPPISG